MWAKRVILAVCFASLVVGIGLGFALGRRGGEPKEPHLAGRVQLLDSFRDGPNNSYCYEFDRVLAVRSGDDPKAILKVAPEVPLKISSTGRTLCVSGFTPSTIYKLELQSAFLAADGTTLGHAISTEVSFGTQSPSLNFSSRGVVLPRIGAVGIPIETVNLDKLHVKVLRVNDRDLAEEMAKSWWRGPVTPWQQQGGSRATSIVWEGSLEVADKKSDATVTTSFPISEVLPNRLPGAYLVIAERWTNEPRQWIGSNAAPWSSEWVIDTDLTLTTLQGESDLVVFARSLDSARTVPATDMVLMADDGTELGRAHADSEGKAVFPAALLRGEKKKSARAILAFAPDGDFTVHDISRPAFDLSDRGVSGREAPGPIDAFVWTDRGIYRPGETVNLALMMRDRLAAGIDTPARIRFVRPDQGTWIERTMTPDAAGGVHLSVELPSSAHMGKWTVEIRTDPKGSPVGEAEFEVQDFTPQTLTVKAKTPDGMVRTDQALVIGLHADWLYGAPGSELSTDIVARVLPDPAPFPQWKGWRFGLFDEKYKAEDLDFPVEETDAAGNAEVSATVKSTESSKPLAIRLQASVLEPGGKPNPSPEVILPIDSGRVFVGLHPDFDGGRVPNGSDALIRLIAVDRSGKAVPQKSLHYTLYRENWHFLWSMEAGGWHFKVTTDDQIEKTGDIETGTQPASLKLPTDQWTRYRLVVANASGDASASLRFAAGWQQSGAGDEDTPDMVSVVPDKDHYDAGETAHVTIKPQFAGEALITLATSNPTETRQMQIGESGKTIDIPVKAEWGAGTYIVVNHHRPLKGEGARGPVRAVGVAWLGVDNRKKTLSVEIKAPEIVRPETILHLPLKVGGIKAGPAFVTVAAVDEGILALTQFETPSPDRHYFAKRQLGVEIRDDYGKLIDGRAAPAGRIRQGGDSSGAKGLAVVPTRTVALYSGPVTLALDGTATVDLPVPDFVGKLRFMAVAYDAGQVGHGEASSIVRYPVVANAYLPRFLAPGDQAQLRVKIDNVEARQGPFHIEMAVGGPFAIKEGASFDFDPDQKAGPRLQLTLGATGLGIGSVRMTLTGPDGLMVKRDWPIQSRTPFFPLSVEQTSQLAVGDSYSLPAGLDETFIPGSVKATLSFSYLHGFDPGALLNSLSQYPYGCTEQTTSVAMPLLSYEDPILIAQSGAIPPNEALRERVQHAVDVLVDRQDESGRIGLWRKDDGWSSSWLVTFATDFLFQAREKGYVVSDEATNRAYAWLNLAAFGNAGGNDYIIDNAQSAQAYALYVLARNRRPNTWAMQNLANNGKLASIGHAMLGAAFQMFGDREAAQKQFTAAEDSIGSERGFWMPLYGSQIRDLAALIALRAETQPHFEAAALLDRLERLDPQAKSTSTQEKAWLLRLASSLSRDAEIDVEADGPQLAGLVQGRQSRLISLTPAQMQSGLTLTNRGRAAVYRTLQVSGIPRNSPPPLEGGLQLRKQWHKMTGETVELSARPIAQQERFVVVVSGSMQDNAHRQMMLVDMLPAGFQIERALKPGKSTTDEFTWLKNLSRITYSDAKDDRLQAAFDVNEPQRLWGTVVFESDDDDDDDTKTAGPPAPPKPAGKDFTLAYVVRAITPGKFVLPSAALEDMYRPTVMGRTSVGNVEIVEK